ncbi:MAG: U32 family peptidase C-terminal domain-containing protein, partial [Oscillospiraceae bacterium]|nr:U32 family peptidase C-terminal domain-containing protein [Oscillospiraceae bacterium]
SNYLTGRDGNRGECAQPCRWKYSLVEEKRPGQYFDMEEYGGTYIMNSNDLCMIEHLQDLMEAGVTSFKIEGRMKSAYYAAVVTNAYRHALDAVAAGDEVPEVWVCETEMVSHRPYCTGFYLGGGPGQCYDGTYETGADIVAVVEGCDEEGNAVLTQRNRFCAGEELELLTPEREPQRFTVGALFDAEGERIPDARHPMMEVHTRLPVNAPRLSILRKRR